jgi:predicted MFS family arabinose efflux permease
MLEATWGLEFRQLSSVYVTAKAMVSAWNDPTVVRSAAGEPVDLDWLLDDTPLPDGRPRANTLFMCAPLHEAQRLAPVLGGLLGDIREGFVYMVRTPWLLATLLFASVMLLAMMGPFEVLIPFLIKDRLGGGPGDHALVMAAFGIGGAVGSLAMASLRMPRRYLTVMNLMWGLGCLPFLTIGSASAIWVVVASAFVLGAMFSAPMVIWGTLLQRRVPAHMLGRVASLDFFVSISLMPVSMALAGPVSAAIGLRNTFLIAAVVPGIAAIVATVWAKLPADEVAHPLRDD